MVRTDICYWITKNDSNLEFEQTLRYEVICDTLRNATCEAVLSVSAGMQSVYLAFRGPRIDDRLVSAIRLDGQFAQFGTYDNFTFPTSANKLNGNDIGGVLPYFHKLFKVGCCVEFS